MTRCGRASGRQEASAVRAPQPPPLAAVRAQACANHSSPAQPLAADARRCWGARGRGQARGRWWLRAEEECVCTKRSGGVVQVGGRHGGCERREQGRRRRRGAVGGDARGVMSGARAGEATAECSLQASSTSHTRMP
eukprot:86329-Rhodomonas_salina.2